MKNFVTFEADLPNDAVWDERHNLVTPGGRGLMRVLVAHLGSCGWPCTSPQQHSFYGWASTVGTRPKKSRLLLQTVGPWLLITSQASTIWARLAGRGADRANPALLEALEAVLSADGRFREIAWWSRAEFEVHEAQVGPGLRHPLGRPGE